MNVKSLSLTFLRPKIVPSSASPNVNASFLFIQDVGQERDVLSLSVLICLIYFVPFLLVIGKAWIDRWVFNLLLFVCFHPNVEIICFSFIYGDLWETGENLLHCLESKKRLLINSHLQKLPMLQGFGHITSVLQMELQDLPNWSRSEDFNSSNLYSICSSILKEKKTFHQ